MEQVVESEPLEQGERPNREGPLAFLVTSVIGEFLRGDPSTAQLLSAEAEGRIRFAINPIVLQELLLAGDADRPEFERIWGHLRVLPVDLAKAEALVPRARVLMNGDRLVHTNDIIIMSSAGECDFLVTRDVFLKNLATDGKPQVVTPEELVAQLRAA